MKGFLTLLILIAAGAAAWNLPAEGRNRHHYSETGVVYTTAYLTLQVPNGIVGFPAGSRLMECFAVHVPDKEVVTDGKYQLVVDPQLLTHDIEYARDLADADQQNQDRVQAGIVQSRDRYAASQHFAALLTAFDIERGAADRIASSTVGGYNSALRQPTSAVGAYGGYGSYGGYSSPNYVSYTGPTVNRLTINQFNSGAGTGSGAGAAYAPTGSFVPRQNPPAGRAANSPGTGMVNPALAGMVAQ